MEFDRSARDCEAVSGPGEYGAASAEPSTRSRPTSPPTPTHNACGPGVERALMRLVQELRTFYAEHGHWRVPRDRGVSTLGSRLDKLFHSYCRNPLKYRMAVLREKAPDIYEMLQQRATKSSQSARAKRRPAPTIDFWSQTRRYLQFLADHARAPTQANQAPPSEVSTAQWLARHCAKCIGLPRRLATTTGVSSMRSPSPDILRGLTARRVDALVQQRGHNPICLLPQLPSAPDRLDNELLRAALDRNLKNPRALREVAVYGCVALRQMLSSPVPAVRQRAILFCREQLAAELPPPQGRPQADPATQDHGGSPGAIDWRLLVAFSLHLILRPPLVQEGEHAHLLKVTVGRAETARAKAQAKRADPAAFGAAATAPAASSRIAVPTREASEQAAPRPSRGRPRKHPVAAAQPPRPRGRPRQNPARAAAGAPPASVFHLASSLRR